MVNVQLTGYSGKVMLQLMDMQGKRLKLQTGEVFSAKTANLQMNVADVASGTYLLEILDEQGNKQISKVVVSR
jgi:hypothetical protein